MNKENLPPQPKPRDVILNAFEDIDAAEIDEKTLVNICIAAKCPNEVIARLLLQKMVDEDQLTVRDSSEHGTMYSPVRSTSSDA